MTTKWLPPRAGWRLGNALLEAAVAARCRRLRARKAIRFGWMRLARLRRREAARCATELRRWASC